MSPGWLARGWNRSVLLLRAVRADRTLCIVFGALLAIDLAWTLWWGGARLIANLGITEYWYEIKPLRIDAEGGYPEWYNYAKTLVLVFLLGRLALTERQSIYVALTVVFVVVLVDDTMTIHEDGGKYFKRALGLRPMFGLRAVDFGEVLTWLCLGVVLGPLLLIGLYRSRGTHRTNGLSLLLAFSALVFFGLVVDQVYHILRDAFFGADILLGMMEDGGEMIAITVACAMAAALVKFGSFDEAERRTTETPESGSSSAPQSGQAR